MKSTPILRGPVALPGVRRGLTLVEVLAATALLAMLATAFAAVTREIAARHQLANHAVGTADTPADASARLEVLADEVVRAPRRFGMPNDLAEWPGGSISLDAELARRGDYPPAWASLVGREVRVEVLAEQVDTRDEPRVSAADPPVRRTVWFVLHADGCTAMRRIGGVTPRNSVVNRTVGGRG